MTLIWDQFAHTQRRGSVSLHFIFSEQVFRILHFIFVSLTKSRSLDHLISSQNHALSAQHFPLDVP